MSVLPYSRMGSSVRPVRPKRQWRLSAWNDSRKVARKWLWFWLIVVTVMYGLLWSPNWYPLSDSSLYLSMGRSFSLGRGLTMMGDPVRLVPPLTPMFLGTLMKLGAGIGVIQGAMIGLMLVSHVLGFLTLRRWTNERIALGAMLGCALSYWVFANAFTIMSEPLCVALMWGGFLALSYVRLRSRWRWVLLCAACLLLVLASANRDAVLCLLPGPLLAVIVRARAGKKWSGEAAGWAILVAVVFGSWFFYRYPPKFLIGMFTPKNKVIATTQATTGPTAVAPAPALAINPEFEAEPESNVREGRYQTKWLNGVKRDFRHMVTEPPVLGGRWVCEGMVMASVGVFESKSQYFKIFGTAAALIAFVLTVIGGLNTFLRGRFWLLNCRFKTVSFKRRWRILSRHSAWWVVGPVLYFTFIWLQWGTRIKPRYMVPVAPVLCLFLWSGMTWLVLLIGGMRKGKTWDGPRVGRIVMTWLVGMVLLGNLFPWAVEFYVRHVSSRNFYDAARRGAYAQLVDIGAYAQGHLGGGEVMWMNAGAHRRIAYFLTGHKIDTSELGIRDWKDWEVLIGEGKLAAAEAKRVAASQPATNPSTHRASGKRHLSYAQRRRRFFTGIKGGRYLIVFVEHPAKDVSWPGWHWPAGANDMQLQWWKLYERQPDDTWKLIKVPPSRDYVKSIPGAAS